MLLLELFSGTQSIGKVAEENDIEVVSLDFREKMNANICEDILKWDYKNEPLLKNKTVDVIWASPDCKTWSIATHKHRTLKGGLKPLTPQAVLGEKLIHKTIEIIEYFKPKLYFIENPRGRLRHFPPMKKFPRYTVIYGNYGHPFNKATDIWTNSKGLENEKPKQKLCNMKYLKIKYDERIVIPKKLCEKLIQNMKNQIILT